MAYYGKYNLKIKFWIELVAILIFKQFDKFV